jgi:hypothetical protein
MFPSTRLLPGTGDQPTLPGAATGRSISERVAGHRLRRAPGSPHSVRCSHTISAMASVRPHHVAVVESAGNSSKMLVERGGELRVTEMFKHVRNLRRHYAGKGKRRELILGKELNVGRFIAGSRRARSQFGHEKCLVGMKCKGRMTVQVAVVQRHQFCDLHFKAGFFAGFAGGGRRGRLAHIGPTSRQSPAMVGEFAHQQNVAVAKSRHTDVNFWSGVA